VLRVLRHAAFRLAQDQSKTIGQSIQTTFHFGQASSRRLLPLNMRLGVRVMRKSNTKKKHQQGDSGKRDRALKLQRRNAKRSTSPMAKAAAPKKLSASREDLRTIEAIRACAADLLKDCKTKPLNLYDAGFQEALKEIGRMLDPGGYSCDRPTTELIAALQEASEVHSNARLQSVEAVRNYLEQFFWGVMRDPSDRPFLYGYEDANWRMWRMVTGGKVATRGVWMPAFIGTSRSC
jgi:hypothetical protein